MCGIIGVLRFGELGDKSKRESAIFFGTTLLELTEPRGKDATGVVTTFDNGMFMGQKMGISATKFIARFGGDQGDFDAYIKVARDYEVGLRTIIGHCRKKSVGGAFDNVNNHPIKAGNIIGVHNGTLTNHEQIFENLKCNRDGDVDSEAIMRLFEYYTHGCKEPFTIDMIMEVAARLNGSFSTLVVNTNNPNQVVSMRDTRPAEYCLIKPLGIVLIASEKKFFDHAIWQYNKSATLFGHKAYQTLRGKDVEYVTLPDDSAALFNLTLEITPETSLADLYETKKLPIKVDRIWKAPVKTNSYNSGYNHKRNNNVSNIHSAGNTNTTNSTGTADGQKKAQDNKGDSGPNNSKNTQSSGTAKVWSNSLNRFVESNKGDIVVGSEKSSLVMDTEKKQVASPREAAEDVALDNEKRLGNPKVTILKKAITPNEEFDPELPIAQITSTPISAKSTFGIKNNDNEEILNEMKINADKGKAELKDVRDAQKASIEAAKKIIKIENAFELAEALNMNVSDLEKLTPVAMANRILREVFGDVFQAGYLAKCEEVEKSMVPAKQHIVTVSKQKIANAMRHVRVLKAINKGLGNALFENDYSLGLNITNNMIDKLSGDTEITEETVKKVFTAGDMRENPAVKAIVTALERK
jgi:hypothetical protein